MVARATTVSFQGIEVVDVGIQVQISSGLPSFAIVGLPDKAVAESRERTRSALMAMGIGLPAKRIVVNLAPADLVKEGSHFDLPIALGLLVAIGALAQEAIAPFLSLGELALDGALSPVNGVLPAAIHASASQRGLICPQPQGSEAAWADGVEVLAAPTLLALLNHLRGGPRLAAPAPRLAPKTLSTLDLADVRGQETAKRALEIAAAGAHNVLMVGPPGSGKSMLAQRLPGLLPPLTPREALEVSMIHSVAGELKEGALLTERPFRDPHHSASVAALVGGGLRARPGEVSLAHRGVLFLDEFPEFPRVSLEALRQPLEAGHISIARANNHVTYPARTQLVAAMNPCRCGFFDDPRRGCGRQPRCGRDYQARLSGPLLDRIDLHVEVAAVPVADLASAAPRAETTPTVAARIAAARRRQSARYAEVIGETAISPTNTDAAAPLFSATAHVTEAAQTLLTRAADQLKLTARAYHRVLRVARTIADLDQDQRIRPAHLAEALTYRQRGVAAG